MRHFAELTDYLARNNESLRAFSLRAGIDKSCLSRLVNGKTRRFDPDLADKLFDKTLGEVGAAELAAFLKRLRAPVARKRRAA
jgi:hypothetical protein